MITKLELRRKTFHILCGIFLIVLLKFSILERYHFLIVLIVGTILALLSKKIKMPLISFILKKLDRKKTFLPAWGAITALAGMVLSLYIFKEDIAFASILILAVGDGFATLIGKMSKTKTPFSKTKTWGGTISGTITAAVAASFFVSAHIALVASMVAMSVELIDFKFKDILDDNILIPIVSGIIITLLMMI
jgi:dolichol kinase